MPWSKRDYPNSMKNLDSRVREKAIEIANALLDEGYEEGRAISIATAKAKEWNEDHPKHNNAKKSESSSNQDGKGSSTAKDDRFTGNLHVVPHQDQWAVKEEGTNTPLHVMETKKEAVNKADKLASDHNVTAIIHRQDGTVETSHNYS